MEKLRFTSASEIAGAKSPEEVANYEARVDLLLAIRDIIEAQGLSQKDLKEMLDMSQPRISNLLNGHVQKFSLGKLIEILQQLDFRMNFKYTKGKTTAKVQLSFEHDLVPA